MQTPEQVETPHIHYLPNIRIHGSRDAQQLVSISTQMVHSYKQKLKTNNVKISPPVQMVSHKNPNFRCADVGGRDLNDIIDDAEDTHEYYQCDTCEKFFYRITEYQEHLINIVINVCTTCGKKFRDYETFHSHFLDHSNPERECSGCFKVFSHKYYLEKHRSICKKLEMRGVRKPRGEIPSKSPSN